MTKTTTVANLVAQAREYNRTGNVTLRAQTEETLRELTSRSFAKALLAGMYDVDTSKPVLRAQSQDCGEAVALRNATDDEVETSRNAGDDGYFDADGVTCFVEE